MKRVSSSKISVYARDFGVYLAVFGVPVIIMLLGFVLGWWETLVR